MNQAIITICYRKIINVHSTHPWDKMVFDDSFIEYRMQVQNIEHYQEYPTYSDLIFQTAEAKQLSNRVAPAVSGYVQQLNGTIPDILDNLGRRFLPLDRYQFEIINTHFIYKERHVVAVNFYSDNLLLHGTVNNYLLLSKLNETENEGHNTHLIQLQPYLSISHIKEILL